MPHIQADGCAIHEHKLARWLDAAETADVGMDGLGDFAAVGARAVFLRLKAEINWHRMFHELIADFDEKALGKRQKAALAAAGVKD